jgi:pSer/pThr/pTyr-binding forkhead associated (FHA) protein
MKARLLCRLGELKGSEFDIDSEATIGRSERNSIVLGSRSISSEHARIFSDDEAGHFVIEDLGSRNGTQLDGKTLRGRQELGGLHVVNFGRSADFVFLVLPEPEVAAEPSDPHNVR